MCVCFDDIKMLLGTDDGAGGEGGVMAVVVVGGQARGEELAAGESILVRLLMGLARREWASRISQISQRGGCGPFLTSQNVSVFS